MDLEVDMKEFIRKLQLKELFHSYNPTNDENIVKPTSDFLPQLENVKNPVLKNVCQSLNSTSENLQNILPKERIFRNISKEEESALDSLIKDDSIIIKEADKGGSVIIMDKTYYITKIESMLNNNKVFKN